jgi:UDP-N-acetylmuramate--alanine ligase
VPGIHNIINAVAACAAAHNAGVNETMLAKGFESFTGAGRRFEIHGCINGVTVVDDYAHHPVEIELTLKAARSMNYNRVWAVHQPFTFSRTKTMLNEFAQSLSVADKVTLTAVMGGRETNTYNVFSEDLSALIQNSNCIDNFEQVADYVVDNSLDGDVIITLGCGDVNKIAKLIVERLKIKAEQR